MISDIILVTRSVTEILSRLMSLLQDYEAGKYTEDDAREELKRIDTQVNGIKQRHWDIVHGKDPK